MSYLWPHGSGMRFVETDRAHRRKPLRDEGPEPLRLPVPLCQTIGKQLLGGVVGAVGSQGFGYVLQEFGLGNGLPASQLERIRGELKTIQASLQKVEKATAEFRAEVQGGGYNILAGQATNLTSRVSEGMARLDRAANLRADDPTKKGYTEETMAFIKEKQVGEEQRELAARLSGEANADGLIVAASKVAKTSTNFWTAHTTEKVRQVFDYYQAMESQMLLLRVENSYVLVKPRTASHWW